MVPLESIEAAAWAYLYRTCGAEESERSRICTARQDGALLVAFSGVDILAFNRVLDLGGEPPVTEGSVARMIDFYREGGCSRFVAALPPPAGSGAAALGCIDLVLETAEETPEHASPSYRNALRFGFRVAYRRPNYLYEFPPAIDRR